MKYSVLADKKSVFASQYLLYMPKEEDLKALIENDIQKFQLDKEH